MQDENQIIYKFIFASFLIIILIIFFVIIQVIYFFKRQNIINSEIQKINITHEKELLITKLEIQEETFNKISREIHDNISLGLTLAKLQINNFMVLHDKFDTMLSTSIDLISKSLVDLNDISKSLDGNELASHGLINALESEIMVLNRSGIYQAELEVIGESVYLDSEIELILLRIFQEACNNILKHARATRIQVDMIYEPGWLNIKITDNGKGFNVEEAKNKKEIRKMSGLNNFYTRAKIIGAELNITSMSGVGTTIHIKIPIKK
jgi:two-component system NarL family sensor kinase